MGSKLARLDKVIQDSVPDAPDVEFRLVLTSFEKYAKLGLDGGAWAGEKGPAQVKLQTVPDRLIIAECDTAGHLMAVGGHVHVEGKT